MDVVDQGGGSEGSKALEQKSIIKVMARINEAMLQVEKANAQLTAAKQSLALAITDLKAFSK